jgi:hypothetical protein
MTEDTPHPIEPFRGVSPEEQPGEDCVPAWMPGWRPFDPPPVEDDEPAT